MKYWVMANGEELLISEMEVTHIKNCIKLLEGNIIDPYDVHGFENGAENGFVHYQIVENNEMFESKIKAFKEELKRR